MKCGRCASTLCCKQCGTRAISTQDAYTKRRLAEARCPRCGRKKSKKDRRFFYCTDCRRKVSAHAKKRYVPRSRSWQPRLKGGTATLILQVVKEHGSIGPAAISDLVKVELGVRPA